MNQNNQKTYNRIPYQVTILLTLDSSLTDSAD